MRQRRPLQAAMETAVERRMLQCEAAEGCDAIGLMRFEASAGPGAAAFKRPPFPERAKWKRKHRSNVGQVVNLRPIPNPPQRSILPQTYLRVIGCSWISAPRGRQLAQEFFYVVDLFAEMIQLAR